MLLMAKLLGVLVFGAILTAPVHVMFGTFAAAWKPKERWVLMVSAAFSFAVMATLIFGEEAALDDAGANRAITAIERERAGVRADLHRSREECKALAMSLATEPQEYRNRQYSVCMEGVRAEAEIAAGELKAIDARIADLKATPR